MKRIFLLALFALNFSPAYAGEWSFDVSGDARGAYGYSDVAERFEKNDENNDGFGDAEVNFSAYYEADEDYSLSFNLDLMVGINEELQDYNQGRWGEEAYVISNTPLGELQGGQMYNVAYQFYEGAPRVGILYNNSDIVNFISNPNWKRTKKETKFATLNTTYINTDGVAPKVNYITPEVFGSKIGISYIPETYNRRGLINKHADYAQDDGWVGAFSTTHDMGFFDINASISYAQFHQDDKEFSAGMRISRGNWSLGGGLRKTYIDGKEEKAVTNAELPEFFDEYREGQSWEIGLGYEFGPFQSALTYFESTSDRTKNQDKVWMFSNQYQLSKNILVYAAAAHVDFEGDNNFLENNNQGWAFVGGVGVTF